MEYLFSLSYHEWLILGTYLLLGAVILFLTFIAHKMLNYIAEQSKISLLQDQHLRSLFDHHHNKLEMVKTQIQVLGLAFEALNNGAKDNFDWLQQNIIDQRQMTGLLREAVLNRIDETYNDTRSTIQGNALTTQNLIHERASDLERHAVTLANMTQSVLGDMNTTSIKRHKDLQEAHITTLTHVKSAIASSERNHSAIVDLTLASSVANKNTLTSIAVVDAKVSTLPQELPPLPADFNPGLVAISSALDALNIGIADIKKSTGAPVRGRPESLHAHIAHVHHILADFFDRIRIGFHLTRDFEKKEALALTLIADAVGVDTSMRTTCNKE